MGVSLLLLALFAAASQVDGQSGEISGTAVNGTTASVPLSGAEVILRASQNGAFVPVAETTTDSQGQFNFVGLPADQSVVYLPGINRAGVHYPGPRVRLLPGHVTARVKLVAYDTVPSPSPLISRRHEIDVQSGAGYLEVTETLNIENPSLTTFIGQSKDDRPPVTLRLSLPDGIEKVTFDREFNGRNFQLHEGHLITDLPWPPGSRELKFIYRVPVERQFSVLTRVLDQPTDHVVVQVTTKESGSVACNLPKTSSQSGPDTVFEHRGTTLPAGHQIKLRLGALPLRFETYARGLAVAVLIALIAGSVLATRARRRDRAGKPVNVRQTVDRQSGARGRRSRTPRRITSSQPNQ
jgi:hypothetical protein